MSGYQFAGSLFISFIIYLIYVALCLLTDKKQEPIETKLARTYKEVIKPLYASEEHERLFPMPHIWNGDKVAYFTPHGFAMYNSAMEIPYDRIINKDHILYDILVRRPRLKAAIEYQHQEERKKQLLNEYREASEELDKDLSDLSELIDVTEVDLMEQNTW